MAPSHLTKNSSGWPNESPDSHQVARGKDKGEGIRSAWLPAAVSSLGLNSGPTAMQAMYNFIGYSSHCQDSSF